MRYQRIEVTGIVQGVGFRPFVYRIANKYGIRGSVSNNVQGVDIRAAGEGDQVYSFLKALKDEAPPQSMIEELKVTTVAPFEAAGFTIDRSDAAGERVVLVSPDLATCPDCRRELFDEGDRRYRYPFINCTNCGPRFTIIADTPYDRPNTSMAKFRMCARCQAEYDDPADRRFHAQPNACPDCGPRLWLADRKGKERRGDAVAQAAKALAEGKIVAVKGLGGFQLAVDATSDEAVAELRTRKQRYGKPLAVMVESVGKARKLCEVGLEEEALLSSPRSPIVLLLEREGSPLSRHVAYGLRHQGLFLPYTPLHHLLVAECGIPLVMTSGNVSEEPIVKGNEEALARLGGIADLFLLHDRDILVRYDDSVSRVFEGAEYPVRRARGYAPYPVRVKPAAPVQVLALGPELKNTFCLLRGEQAFVSQHIGDMQSREEVAHFEEALAAIKRLFSLEPRVVAHDLHPDYMTTQMAAGMPLPRVGVQHHHAHIVSCMADAGVRGELIGVAWDGTGYGTDGTVWGGEFLVADETGFERAAHLRAFHMPGSDACIYNLHRMVMGVLYGMYGEAAAARERLQALYPRVDEQEAESLVFQLEKGVNAPLTSSAGRMFDVTAALAGLRWEAQYDGQAACELEAVARPTREYYNFILDKEQDPWVVDTVPVFEAMLEDVGEGASAATIAGKFHASMALAIITVCRALSRETGLKRVALSGGVFQNELLTALVTEGLRTRGLQPLLQRRVPCNDGGISLGQAVAAAASYEKD